MKYLARTSIAVGVYLAASAGCAGAPPVGQDPSNWVLEPERVAETRRYYMSVERFFEFVDKGFGHLTPSPSWGDEISKKIARSEAEMYVTAILDAGEGQQWCIAEHHQSPVEVHAALIEAIREAPATGNAAHALQSAARNLYPCN